MTEATSFRLVCHACGTKFPRDTAMSAGCCSAPEPRVHTGPECWRCTDKPVLKIGEQVIGIVTDWKPSDKVGLAVPVYELPPVEPQSFDMVPRIGEFEIINVNACAPPESVRYDAPVKGEDDAG